MGTFLAFKQGRLFSLGATDYQRRASDSMMPDEHRGCAGAIRFNRDSWEAQDREGLPRSAAQRESGRYLYFEEKWEHPAPRPPLAVTRPSRPQ
jgi:hypothetical protein